MFESDIRNIRLQAPMSEKNVSCMVQISIRECREKETSKEGNYMVEKIMSEASVID